MTASAPTSSLFQPWERQGNPWKQRPDQIRCAPGKRKGLVRATTRSECFSGYPPHVAAGAQRSKREKNNINFGTTSEVRSLATHLFMRLF